MYGDKTVGEEGSSRRVGGIIKVRIVLSALDVIMEVPSGALGSF